MPDILLLFLGFYSTLFIFMKHPLSSGLILLSQTVITSLITGMMNLNFWYSYILFLIMIGGMLILFIYMTSIASNEKFIMNFYLKYLFYLLVILSVMSIFIDPYYYNFFYQLNEMKLNFHFFKNYISIKKYFNFPNNLIMLKMIIYLFITLIAIVKITKTSHGSLRQKF